MITCKFIARVDATFFIKTYLYCLQSFYFSPQRFLNLIHYGLKSFYTSGRLRFLRWLTTNHWTKTRFQGESSRLSCADGHRSPKGLRRDTMNPFPRSAKVWWPRTAQRHELFLQHWPCSRQDSEQWGRKGERNLGRDVLWGRFSIFRSSGALVKQLLPLLQRRKPLHSRLTTFVRGKRGHRVLGHFLFRITETWTHQRHWQKSSNRYCFEKQWVRGTPRESSG